MLNNNSLLKISAAPVAVLILHIIAIFTGWYELFWWFDIPLHFLGGVAVAISGYFLLADYVEQGTLTTTSLPLHILILISFVSLAAVSWELLEFAIDRYTETIVHQPSLLDTMKDLAMGLSGGALTAIILMFKKHN